MKEADHKLIQALARCRFAPGTWAKQFAHDLATYPIERTLSERQQAALYRTAWHYRRQLAEQGITVDKPADVAAAEEAAEEVQRQREQQALKAWNEGKPL